ncbi:neuroglobin-like [Culicoides brevitarsis]|uniref:neuroglobin-like n=1 Tax=Culicoides brevitarsis TaxID=469753 RepID=UPI00307C8853
MGCELSKLASSGPKGSDKNRNFDCDNPNTQVVPKSDPRLPLNPKQKYSMIASWKGISRAMEQTGVNMFVKLFEENAELLSLFDKFQELKTREQQATSEELAEHATKVMESLDEGIRSLDDVDAFLNFVHQIGASHTKIPGFKGEYFWRIEKPFLDAVQQTLGDRYTENVDGIYKITIKFIIETLIAGFESGSANNDTTKSKESNSKSNS